MRALYQLRRGPRGTGSGVRDRGGFFDPDHDQPDGARCGAQMEQHRGLRGRGLRGQNLRRTSLSEFDCGRQGHGQEDRRPGRAELPETSSLTLPYGLAASWLKVVTKAEAFYADLERCAFAMQQVLEQSLQAERPFDPVFDLLEFAASQFFPPGPNRSLVAQAAQEQFGFGKGKVHLARETD